MSYNKVIKKLRFKYFLLYWALKWFSKSRRVFYYDLRSLMQLNNARVNCNQMTGEDSLVSIRDWLNNQFWLCRNRRDFYKILLGDGKDKELEKNVKVWHSFTLMIGKALIDFSDAVTGIRYAKNSKS